MATSIFNDIIKAAARKLKDERSSASSSDDTGHVYNSALLSEYANRSIRDFLIEKIATMGPQAFAQSFPEYVKTSGNLTLSAGAVAKPTDAFIILNVVKSDLSVKFDEIEPENVASVLAGEAGLGDATTDHPRFYDEAGYIKTLGVTTGDIIARYIRTQPDLAVITAATGNGKIYTDNAYVTWTAATRTLSFDLAGTAPGYTSADIGKLVIFNSATVVYIGRIQSVDATGDPILVVLSGDGLPAGNITATNILAILCSDQDPDDNDLKLATIWHGDIIEKMAAMGENDAVRITRAS